eukprot:gb/GFBE01055279.1/.p1 GENE.gb/GFBE01055279.1/~~gb/GFBE01055279.1/.p1  ORF type:complete len:423 (+),score=65.89 gb/GFBE01055279.1/:1-1269(+)
MAKRDCTAHLARVLQAEQPRARRRRLVPLAALAFLAVLCLVLSFGTSASAVFDWSSGAGAAVVLLGRGGSNQAEKRRQEELKAEKRKQKEEEMRIIQEEEEEKRRKQKEEEEAAKRKQKEEEQEAKRKQQALKDAEDEAVTRARLQARRPLNSFEERRVRRQVRSEFLGGAPSMDVDRQRADWSTPLRPEVKGQLDDAVKFFADTMRVPAILIGSAALGMLFVPPFKWACYKESTEQRPLLLLLWRLYVILATATLCTELTTVLGTSNAHVQLLELGRSGLALEPSAMDLIMAHIEFEYLTCSLSFLTGVICFMLAIFCRVCGFFNCSEGSRMPRQPELCVVVGGMILSSLLWWLHLTNVRMMEFSNFGAMSSRFFLLLWARLRNGEIGVIGLAALATAGTSAAVAARMLLDFLSSARSEKD